jgi:hypothetical protein
MLFDLGADYKTIQIDMTRMLFPLDIIFINSTQGVVGVMHNVQPGETDVRLENEQLPGARCFLEINAGEAEGIEAGDFVNIQGYTQPAQFNVNTLINFMGIAMILFMMMRVVGQALEEPTPILLPQAKSAEYEFKPGEIVIYRGERVRVSEQIGDWVNIFIPSRQELVWVKPETLEKIEGEAKPKGKVFFIGSCKVSEGMCLSHGYSISETVKCPNSPLTDEEWKAAFELVKTAFPEGQSNPWVNGWWPETREEAEKAAREYEWKMRDAIRMFREKQRVAIENYERGADKAIYNYRQYVMREYERRPMPRLTIGT